MKIKILKVIGTIKPFSVVMRAANPTAGCAGFDHPEGGVLTWSPWL
jgi:hypothetical protein